MTGPHGPEEPARYPERVLRRRPRALLLALGVVGAVVLLLLGIYLGGHPSSLPGPLRSAFVSNDDERFLSSTLGMIKDDYYRKIPNDQLVNSSLTGAVASLDDKFSHYFDPKTYRQFQDTTNPSFDGIGVTVEQDPKGLRVATVYPGTPAARAGIEPGDLIVAVGTTSLAGRAETVSTGLVRGPDGTTVTLTIEHDGRRRQLQVARSRITQPVVADRVVTRGGRKLADIVFTSFTANSSSQVRQAVDRDLARGAQGIVLDLRGNGGGLLEEAVETASIFINDGTIVSTAGRVVPRHVYTATGGAIKASIPVVVLVDQNTASSAEIVTGALQDRGRARVVGTHTYGKGVFQEIRELSNGGALDITVGQYFLPSGKNLGGRGVSEGAGIQPNVEVRDNPETKTDEALAVALRTLAGEVR